MLVVNFSNSMGLSTSIIDQHVSLDLRIYLGQSNSVLVSMKKSQNEHIFNISVFLCQYMEMLTFTAYLHQQ